MSSKIQNKTSKNVFPGKSVAHLTSCIGNLFTAARHAIIKTFSWKSFPVVEQNALTSKAAKPWWDNFAQIPCHIPHIEKLHTTFVLPKCALHIIHRSTNPNLSSIKLKFVSVYVVTRNQAFSALLIRRVEKSNWCGAKEWKKESSPNSRKAYFSIRRRCEWTWLGRLCVETLFTGIDLAFHNNTAYCP